MKKMVLLASLMALAALTLAAAPALAQDGEDRITICHQVGGPQEFQEITVANDATFGGHIAHPGDIIPAPAGGCPDGDDGNGDGDGDGNGDGNGDDGDDRDFRNFCRFFDCRDDDDNNNVVPAFEITQDFEQEAESGDVDQSVNVSQEGDNSIQTVGVQPTANTGNAQNAIGVIDAGPFVGDFAGDRVFVNDDDDNGFFDDGRFIRCDEDGDGNNDDDCDDFDDGRVFCDRDNDGNDDGDDDCFVFDHDNGDDDNDNDRVIIRDGDRFNVGDVGGGDTEIEDVNSTIDVSPNLTVNGGGEINQAAAASSTTHWVLTPHGWVLM
jgi:hypothetical protein